MNNWLVPTQEEIIPFAASPDEVVDADWTSRPITIGDDQGRHSSCAIFSFAEWHELKHGESVSNSDCFKIYKQALKDYDLPYNSGLTFQGAYRACRKAGLLPETTGILGTADFRHLPEQPLLVGVKLTGAFDSVAKNGCLNHKASLRVRGYHAMVVLRVGKIEETGTDDTWIVLKNHWTKEWGWNGLCILNYDLWLKIRRELWYVI